MWFFSPAASSSRLRCTRCFSAFVAIPGGIHVSRAGIFVHLLSSYSARRLHGVQPAGPGRVDPLQLPAQALATSLSQIAQQAKIQLLFDEELLRNVKAPALNGDFTAEAAIRGAQKQRVQPDQGRAAPTSCAPEAASDHQQHGLQLGAISVIGNGKEVDSSSVGRSTLNQAEIDRHQANNIPSLINTLPGVTLGGSLKPGGQTINIWGLGDAEDVPMTVDGATKSGFERYQQGTIFIEPELIKRIEVEKGPHSVNTGNGGFGGTVHMETKDAPDLLQEGRESAPWSSTVQQQQP